MTDYIIQILMAGIASLGFAILYNVRGKRLIVPFSGGILTWGLYILLSFLNDKVLQCLIVTIFLSVYTEIAARTFKTPTTTFLVPNIIILIPGGSLYFTIISIIQEKWTDFIIYGRETLFIAAAIAGGIMVVSSVVKIIYNIKR